MLVGIEEPQAQELFLGAVHFRSPETESINAGQIDHLHFVISSFFAFTHKK